MAFFCFFFFKQKTAYEMRISDWSSDVCSSDLKKADATAAAEAERQAARIAAQEKITQARAAAAAVEAAQRREQQAIKLSAQTARQAALEARRLAQTAANPSTRGVAPGSIDRGGRSVDRKRVVEGTNVSVRVEHGGCRNIKKKKQKDKRQK